jgi:hypothetical protein
VLLTPTTAVGCCHTNQGAAVSGSQAHRVIPRATRTTGVLRQRKHGQVSHGYSAEIARGARRARVVKECTKEEPKDN